jgi:hypothetical protein
VWRSISVQKIKNIYLLVVQQLINSFSGLVVKLAVAKRSSECSVSASPVFDSRLMHAFLAPSLRFSGLVVKLAVAIWDIPEQLRLAPCSIHG